MCIVIITIIIRFISIIIIMTTKLRGFREPGHCRCSAELSLRRSIVSASIRNACWSFKLSCGHMLISTIIHQTSATTAQTSTQFIPRKMSALYCTLLTRTNSASLRHYAMACYSITQHSIYYPMLSHRRYYNSIAVVPTTTNNSISSMY